MSGWIERTDEQKTDDRQTDGGNRNMETSHGKEGTMPGRNKGKKRLTEKPAERKTENKPYAKSMTEFVMRGGVQLSLFLKDWKGIE